MESKFKEDGKTMRNICFLLVSLMLLFAVSTAGQNAKAGQTPQSTPEIPWYHYEARIEPSPEPDPTGERKFTFVMDVGNKFKSESLLDELRDAGIPVQSAAPAGFKVSYPETMDDCHIMYDAWRAAAITVKHLKKTYTLHFDSSDLGGEGHYYQTVPPKCGFLFKDAAILPSLRPFYLRPRDLINLRKFATIVKLQN